LNIILADFQKIEGIFRRAIEPRFVEQMRARAPAGIAQQPNFLVQPDRFAGLHQDAVEMRVAGGEAVAMVDLDDLAIAGLAAGKTDNAGGGGIDRRALGPAQVDADMEFARPGPVQGTGR
jgi:hypothetical protein